MTTDDKLLLADLERIANALSQAWDQVEDDDRPSQVNLCLSLRRACREANEFRERLERRLNLGL